MIVNVETFTLNACLPNLWFFNITGKVTALRLLMLHLRIHREQTQQFS